MTRRGKGDWRLGVAGLLGLATVLVSRPAGAADRPPAPLLVLQARAPVEVLAQGFRAPTGVAVAPDGRVFFTDEKEGSLFEVPGNGAPGPPRLLANGLRKPRGLTWEGPGSLLLVAEGLKPTRREERTRPQGLLLRFDLASGAIIILADGLKRPRGLVRAEDGTVYLSAEGLRRPGESDEEDENGENGDEDREERQAAFPGTIFRWRAATGLQPVARGFKRPDGLVLLADGSLLVAAERYHQGAQRLRGSLFRIDHAGLVTLHLPDRLKRPSGLAQDGTGALFLSAERPGNGRGRFPGVILKLPEGKPPHDFATGLDRPRGLAFDKAGHLLVADAEAGFLLRFRAPPSPTLDHTPPVATNQDPFRLQGSTAPDTQILVLGGRERVTAPPGTDGKFQGDVPLRHNEENPLQVFAVGASGQGLASAPAALMVTHDDIPPSAPLVHPVRSPTDQPSQVVTGLAEAGSLVRITGGAALAEQQLGPAETAFALVVPLRQETTNTLLVTATDAAGNTSAPTTVLIVHRTLQPPTITRFTPTAGKVGTSVTLTGTNFRNVQSVAFNGVAAPAFTVANSSTLTVAVPSEATTGRITVTTSSGTANSTGSFVVLTTQDFSLTVAPTTVTAIAGTSVSVQVRTVTSGGYTGLAQLSTGPLPAGVAAAFNPPYLGPNASGTLTLTTSADTPIGNSIEVRGTATIDGTVTTRTAIATLSVQAAGQTVLVGQVRDEAEKPIGGVTIKLGGPTPKVLGTTDPGGNFLVPLGVVGSQVFLIDGSTANTSTVTYASIPVTVTIQPNVVNTLGFIPHLHAQPVTQPLPVAPATPTPLTFDNLPDFQVTIPPGVKIIGWDGQENTQIGVRAVPLDRLAVPPLPAGVETNVVYMFSFGKVGGGTPTAPIPVAVPNTIGAYPGQQVELWYFNEAPDGSAPNAWERFGYGTVSTDGKLIVSNPGVGIPRFCCGAWFPRPPPPPPNTPPDEGAADPCPDPCGGSTQGGDPVELGSGIFLHRMTDLTLPGRIPVLLTRTYRTNDPTLGPFGIGTSTSYDAYLRQKTTDLVMIFLPGNYKSRWARQPDGSFAVGDKASFRAAVLTRNADSTWTLRYKDGRRWQFNSAGWLIAQQDRNGNQLTIVRDSQNRINGIRESGGRELAFSYSGSDTKIQTVQDPLGRQVRYQYDGSNRLIQVTDPAGGTWQYTYDSNHRMLTVTNPRNILQTQNTYDAGGRVATQTLADGGVTQFAYTVVAGTIAATQVTDPLGTTRRYRFTGGYAAESTDALGQSVKTIRAPGSNLVQAQVDRLGRTATYAYDSRGNVSQRTDSLNQTWSFTYDLILSYPSTAIDPVGQMRTLSYDSKGNLTALTDPLGHATTFGYNQFGQPASVTDALGNTTNFEYDSVGSLIATIDSLGNRSERTYDDVSRLIAIKDAKGAVTRLTYDVLDRVVSVTDPLGGQTSFTYDPNGNLLTLTDARGNTTTHTYDGMNRLVARTDPMGRTEGFIYFLNGNLKTVTDRKGQVTTHSYDAQNRRIRSDYADGSFVTYEYDPNGRLLAATDSQTGTITNTYDALGRLVSQVTPQGAITYSYDALGRRQRMEVNGLPPVAYQYDAASRLIQVQQGAQTVTITYDAVNRRTSLTLPNGVTTTYTYDGASRLTAQTYTASSGLLGYLTYTYDPNGNRIAASGTWARSGIPNSIFTSSYDAANQQLVFGNFGQTFDANGNLLTQTDATGTTTYTWDGRNRLIRVSGPTISASFAYDALGRRITKAINGSNTSFHYDGADIAREGSATGDVAYLRMLAADEILTHTGPTGTTAYLADPLGSTVALVDSTGSPGTEYIYEPFGATQFTGAPSFNPFQFTGRENDYTGHYYFRARYYDPGSQRFISADPLGSMGGINSYAYVGNNPLNSIDPFGLDTWAIGIGGSSGYTSASGRGISETSAVLIGVDTQGNVALLNVHGPLVSAGTPGPSVQVGVQTQVTNAQEISELAGPFRQGGATIGAPAPVGGVIVPLSTSADVFAGEASRGGRQVRIEGSDVIVGLGTPGVSVSGGITQTEILWRINIFDLLRRLFTPMGGCPTGND